MSIAVEHRVGTVEFWQTRPPHVQWRPQHQYASAATTAFYSAKSRQDRSLAGLTSRGGPVEHVINATAFFRPLCAFVQVIFSPNNFINRQCNGTLEKGWRKILSDQLTLSQPGMGGKLCTHFASLAPLLPHIFRPSSIPVE